MSVKHFKIKEKGDFVITIGSDDACDLPLDGSRNRISPFHAELKRVDDRLFIKDTQSKQGTLINGKRIRNRWYELTLHDDVHLGDIPVEIKPELLLGRDRVKITADGVSYSIIRGGLLGKIKFILGKTEKTILTDQASFEAEPGSLTGIMGPSGAGKTILLDLLSGYRKPENGIVMAGNFNVHESFGLIKDIIGYVPQEDTLIPELTVSQSLHYCLRLNYPDMHPDIRQKKIEEVLVRMGFDKEQLPKLLDTEIGSKDRRGLSGGERRRVNIAHELIRNPLILFLDEPTSGLSSVDSEHVITLLKEICQISQVTMLMTIHQPGKKIFDMLNQLLLVNKGGKIAYVGPADEAVDYFENLAKQECGTDNPANFILKTLDEWKKKINFERCFEAFRHNRHRAGDENTTEPDESGDETAGLEARRKKSHLFHHFRLLTGRNLNVRLSDMASMNLLVIQAVIIGFLINATFLNYADDFRETDKFAKAWFLFQSQYKDKLTALNLQEIRTDCRIEAEQQGNRMISGNAAQRRASILFLLTASSLWFGIINGAREIVSESAILKREAKSNLNLFSYLMAKIFVLTLFALAQTGILLAICSAVLHIDAEQFLLFWLILFFTASAASALSLLVSAVVKTEQAALLTVPILIIPQLIMGGLIRPYKFLPDDPVLNGVSYLILQKWGFFSLMFLDTDSNRVLEQTVKIDAASVFDYICFDPVELASVFIGNAANGSLMHSGLVMLGHAVLPISLAYLILKKRYS